MKLFIFFVYFCLTFASLFGDTIFTPIKKTYGFDRFTDNALYPFGFSKVIYKLDDKTSLKFIEEVETDNLLFHDILKVEVVAGYYKGVVCYVQEEFVKINLSDAFDVYVIFKYDCYTDKGKFIPKDTKMAIKETRIESGVEILSLSLNNGENIDFTDKRAIRYITNKTDELNSALKSGKMIVKVVNSRNLFPIKGVFSGEWYSDEYGIIITDKKDLYLQKDGFSPSLIRYDGNNSLYLAFMEELNKIKILDASRKIYGDDYMELYNLDIDSDKKFNFLVMENAFSVLNLPKCDYDYIAKKAFYIDGISQDDKIICKIKTLFHPIKVLKFDTNSLKWEESEIEYNEASVTFKISKSGFYLAVLENFDESVETVKISNNYPCSKPFFINKDRTFFSNEKILKDEEVEIITFSSYNPYELYQKIVKKNEKDIKIEIIPRYEKCKKFHDLYYGEWDRSALKKDGKKIEKDRNKIELLGNMSLIENNYIVFKDNGVLLEGKFEILDKDKILLNIKNVNYPLLANGYSEFYKISPSLFENELIIPLFFSFYAGNLEFSFDEICFSRRKNFYKTDNSYIEAEYVNLYKTIFPRDEKNARFKIYFFKGRY